MSRENVEIVQRMYEAFHAGDADGALARFDPDVEFDAAPRVDVGTVRGRDQVAAAIGGWVGTWDEWREEIEEIRDLGGRVLVISTQHGRSRETGMEVSTRYAVLYEVEGDRIIRMGLYAGPEEALAAAGREE